MEWQKDDQIIDTLDAIMAKLSIIENKITGLESDTEIVRHLDKKINELKVQTIAPRALHVGNGLILAKLALTI